MYPIFLSGGKKGNNNGDGGSSGDGTKRDWYCGYLSSGDNGDGGDTATIFFFRGGACFGSGLPCLGTAPGPDVAQEGGRPAAWQLV